MKINWFGFLLLSFDENVFYFRSTKRFLKTAMLFEPVGMHLLFSPNKYVKGHVIKMANHVHKLMLQIRFYFTEK